jgi:hypothetical protein
MKSHTARLTVLVLSLVATLGSAAAAQTNPPKATRQSDVIYGRKFGVALTMEVFTAATRNGIGVVWIVSSSGKSSRDQTLQNSFERRIAPLLEHGYTVFAVIPGSAPIFNVQDQVIDVTRAVRFVRHRAADSALMVSASVSAVLRLADCSPCSSRCKSRMEIQPPTMQWNANLAGCRPSAASSRRLTS